MHRPKFLFFVIFALILTAAAGTSLAQSTDRDHPMPLNSGEISGNMNDHDPLSEA